HHQYVAATQQSVAFAVQSMLATFPEFQGLTVEQLPAALQVLKTSNPQRHADAVQHLARVDQLGNQARAVQQHQQAQTQAITQQWIEQQDKLVDECLAKNESPETVHAVKNNLLRVVTSYGVDENEFRQAISQTPLLRSAPVQRMFFDLVKTAMLRDSAA